MPPSTGPALSRTGFLGRCPGTAMCRMEYQGWGKNASMTFYAYFGHPPDVGELELLDHQLGLWESLGILIPLGYSSLRSIDSHFVGMRLWSLDPDSNARYFDEGFDRPGLVPGQVSEMLPSPVSPMIYWKTANPERRRRGRTYCVGISAEATRIGYDPNNINPIWGDGLITIMNDLTQFMQNANANQVLIQTHQGGRLLDTFPIFPVAAAGTGDGILGVQRRRLRRGR